MNTKKTEVERDQGLSRRELIVNAGVGQHRARRRELGVDAADAEKVAEGPAISLRLRQPVSGCC